MERQTIRGLSGRKVIGKEVQLMSIEQMRAEIAKKYSVSFAMKLHEGQVIAVYKRIMGGK